MADPRRPSGDPAKNKVWTITLPDGSGFDLIVANTYESHSGIGRLIELAGVEGYASDAHGPLDSLTADDLREAAQIVREENQFNERPGEQIGRIATALDALAEEKNP